MLPQQLPPERLFYTYSHLISQTPISSDNILTASFVSSFSPSLSIIPISCNYVVISTE